MVCIAGYCLKFSFKKKHTAASILSGCQQYHYIDDTTKYKYNGLDIVDIVSFIQQCMPIGMQVKQPN